MRKTVKVTVYYVGASFGDMREWTEYVECPAGVSSDRLFTRCERNMRRYGYETRGGSYQVYDGGARRIKADNIGYRDGTCEWCRGGGDYFD